jgi:hypothetical protein
MFIPPSFQPDLRFTIYCIQKPKPNLEPQSSLTIFSISQYPFPSHPHYLTIIILPSPTIHEVPLLPSCIVLLSFVKRGWKTRPGIPQKGYPMRLHYPWPFSGASGSRADGSVGLEPDLVVLYLVVLKYTRTLLSWYVNTKNRRYRIES